MEEATICQCQAVRKLGSILPPRLAGVESLSVHHHHESVSACHGQRHQNVVHLKVVDDECRPPELLREAVQEAVEETDSAAVWGLLLAAPEACDPYHVQREALELGQ